MDENQRTRPSNPISTHKSARYSSTASDKSRRGGIPRTVVTRSNKGSKRLIFQRTFMLMVICGVGMFLPLIWQLWDIAIVKHDQYGGMAASQQTKNVSVSANRGNIYDAKGNTLAMSATVYKLILSPLDVIAKVDKKEFEDKLLGSFDEVGYNKAIEARRMTLAMGIHQILPDLTVEDVLARMEKTNSQYEVIADDIEEEVAQEIREFLTQENCGYDLWLTPDSKRYYPYSQMASGIIGFVNDNGGAYGVEAALENQLKGTEGRVVTAKTGRGTEMYNSYSSYEDAVNGYNVTLTIDATIQAYAEKALAEGIENYHIQEGGYCIVMDPNTGALLAAASAPYYDLNNYAEVIDPMLLADIEADTKKIAAANAGTPDKTPEEIQTEARQEALTTARNAQWKSLTFQHSYEPGSTFKALVLAAALEEGLVHENDIFHCTGSSQVAGWDKPIHCSKRTGHGTQTLAQAVQNSCNPAFMEIGARMGTEMFMEYFKAYGLNDATGFELPGEYPSTMWSSMSNVDLAVASFGQRFNVNPLQMMAGFATTINGGYLVEPYVVDAITNTDGSTVEKRQPTVVRQVISQETSQTTRQILESVVAEGSGQNARVAGYSVGGKTGTSETLIDGELVVSFMGFAPADDPQILVLMAYNTPQLTHVGSNYSTSGDYVSGGAMAAKKAGPLIAEVLDYMGVKREFSEEEWAMSQVSVPNLNNLTVEEAAIALEAKHLTYRTVGEGDVITSQVPARGAVVSGNSTIILYLGDATPDSVATVPNLTGLTYDQAKETLEKRGLFLSSDTYLNSTSTIEGQSISAGETVILGTVIKADFSTIAVEDGYVLTG